ncbi:MAG: aminoacetone oxidase family FAD-binding enzyme, partial [Oscillospiraceae bacterium]
MTDLIIIGGGASGLALATMVKLLAPTLSVKILEKNDRVAKKLIVTGNGCCNITNQCFRTDKYHGSSPLFAKFSLENFPPQKQALFFESMGVLVDFEADGRAYPLSRQASCVVDALRFSADEQNVGILCNKQALQINHPKDYEVVCSDEVLTCRCVAIACGSIAGGKLGSDFGYRLLKGLGHTINERRPAIVQIKTEPELVRQLKGIKVMANASVLLDNHLQRAEYGEVLFCEYGLSGPPILQLSRIISFNKGAEISLDFMHNKSLETLSSILFARRDILRLRPLSEFLSGMLNKRLGQVILKNCGFDISKDSGSLSDSDIL